MALAVAVLTTDISRLTISSCPDDSPAGSTVVAEILHPVCSCRAHAHPIVSDPSGRPENVPVLAKPFEGQKMLALVELFLNTTPEVA